MLFEELLFLVPLHISPYENEEDLLKHVLHHHPSGDLPDSLQHHDYADDVPTILNVQPSLIFQEHDQNFPRFPP
ncbi:hypothetical protein T231_11190 [Tannerella sp. oral taxon BU063 isolate Cell 6/7/9]|uniref:Uncharacterized protein n=1 Tax=Tannerella sp. oral taxon BU063 isolate Cell 6/7/9 TaxID=1411021 RepID=W2CPR2_9BACT|nr:hypothetical protein T231_11190 [Tannerella sp. oral taxon BU063 isolate Cell 6/7/9]